MQNPVEKRAKRASSMFRGQFDEIISLVMIVSHYQPGLLILFTRYERVSPISLHLLLALTTIRIEIADILGSGLT